MLVFAQHFFKVVFCHVFSFCGREYGDVVILSPQTTDLPKPLNNNEGFGTEPCLIDYRVPHEDLEQNVPSVEENTIEDESGEALWRATHRTFENDNRRRRAVLQLVLATDALIFN